MNYEQMNNNRVELKGVVVTKPVYSHEIAGEGFYEFVLNVPRLSDSSDKIPVTISERLMQEGNLDISSPIAFSGQFRSYNKEVNGKSKLMLTVFVREFLPFDEHVNTNTIEISGFICKDPIYRTTPFKREICDVLIAVNRAYNKSDYLPCIAWGRNARYVKNFKVGTRVNIIGRIQSREYQKKNGDDVETRVAYEISINKIASTNADDQMNFVDDLITATT